MGISIWADIVIVAGCIFLSGLFSGAETGSYSGLSRIRLRRLAREGVPAARRLQALLADHALFISTMLVGTNVATYVASAVVTVRYEGVATGRLTPDLAAALTLMLPVLLFGEVLPKGLFYHRADTLMYRLTGVLRAFRLLFLPITLVMRGAAGLVQRLGGRGEQRSWTVFSRAALASRIEQAGADVTARQRGMAGAVLRMGATPVAELMTPMEKALVLPGSGRAGEFIELIRENAVTRVPLHGAERSEIIGMVHLFDMIGEIPEDEPLSARMREIPRLAAATSLRDALFRLRRERREIAAVEDADGRAVGIVYLEDLAAAIVRARAGE